MITMYLICALVYLILLQAQTRSLTLPEKEMVVYPILLESRDADGRKTLKITDDLTLNLESSNIFSDNVLLITTADDGHIVKGYENAEDYEENLYHDSDKMASVMVTPDVGAVRVDGVVGDTLRIKPLLSSERSSEGHVAHLLSRIEMRKPFTPEASERSGDNNNNVDDATENATAKDYAPPPTTGSQVSATISERSEDNNQVDATQNATAKDYAPPPPTGSQVSELVPEERADQLMYVETHMVVETTHAKKFNYGRNKILTYLAILGNAVNLRYRQMTNPRVKIVIVGVTIQQGNEPYLKRIYSNSDTIKPMDTVMALAEYIKGKKDYKQADIVMLITTLNIGSFEGDATAGFTLFGSVCGEYRTGSFEDDPESYDATYIFAHEMAHGLGVVHDGSGPDNSIQNHPGAYSCSSSNGYIMGDYSFDEHHYQFSTCSVQQIQNTYRLTKTYQCLHVKNNVKKIPSSLKYPGEIVPYDKLCKIGLKHLDGQYFYDKKKGITKCNINCISSKGRDGYTYYATVRALDGAACDSKDLKMACFNGKCVNSAVYKNALMTKKKKP